MYLIILFRYRMLCPICVFQDKPALSLEELQSNHFVYGGCDTRKAYHSAEMMLGFCPFTKLGDHFIDFHIYRSDIAEECFLTAPCNILHKSIDQLLLIEHDRVFKLLELLYSPFNIKSFSFKEILSLPFNNVSNSVFCINHVDFLIYFISV